MGEAISVRRYRPECEVEWNEFLLNARNRSFLFNRSYMDYHKDRFADHSLMILRGDQLIGVLPVNEIDSELFSHNGLTFGGLIVHDNFRLEHAFETFEAIIRYGRGAGLRRLTYRPAPHCYCKPATEEDLVAICRLGGSVIDVKPMSVLHPQAVAEVRVSRPTEIRRAERQGILIATDYDWDGFIRICSETLAHRHGAQPVHSGAEMAMLAARFPDNIQLIGARQRGVLIGGLIVYENRCCDRLQYIGVVEEQRRNGVLSALQCHAVERASKRQTWLDFGPSVDPATDTVNFGMTFAKESYGARTIAQMTFALDFS